MNVKNKFVAALSGLVVLVAGSLVAAPANAGEWWAEGEYTWVSWKVPAGTVQGTPRGASDVGWPQTFVSVGQITPACGEWYQVDKYRGNSLSLSWLWDDGLLTGGPSHPEDSSVVVDWYFVYGGDCVDPEPGEDVSAVSECTGEGLATVTTTTTPWTRVLVDGQYEYTYGETLVVTTVVDDEGCDTPDAPTPTPIPATPTFTG